jgi:hypothetical protein
MVKNYNDKQLLDRVKSLKSFKGFPKGYWILGVQSQNDAFNVFDDKFYLFLNDKFVMVTSGTTNAGKNGLLKYESQNPEGCAVIKTNEWYYDVWKFGLHRGKMEALKQSKPFLISRDGDRDEHVEENNSIPVICGINFHANTYDMTSTEIKQLIGGWSLGCQVVNNVPKYKMIIDFVKTQKIVTYCLIKEF